MTTRRIRDAEIGRGWHRLVIIAAVVALVTEGALGTVAMIQDFGPELATPFDHINTGAPALVFAWEAVQLLGAISLPFIAVLVLRGSRPGLFGALTLQLAAVVASGYRMVDTLPDTFWLIGVVTVTTLLLATKSVRDWCLGRSDPAFEHLIATPNVGSKHGAPHDSIPPAPPDGNAQLTTAPRPGTGPSRRPSGPAR